MPRMTDDELLAAIAPVRWSRAWWRTRAPAAAGILVTGILVNAIWETIARPGLGWLSQLVLNAGAGLSDYIANRPFEAAALDPDTLPATQLLILTFSVLAGILTTVSLAVLARGRLFAAVVGRDLDEVSNKARTETEARELRRSLLDRKLRLYGGLFTIVALALLASTLFSVSNLAAAIEVARVHRANIAILKPHSSDHDIDVLNARFASMRTRSDYAELRRSMNEIAKKVGIELRQVNWFRE